MPTKMIELTFPMKIPCTGCRQVIDVANRQEFDDLAAGRTHLHYFGSVDPDAEKKRYEEGYAKGFAAGFETGRVAQQ